MAYRDNSVSDDQIRLHRVARGDIRVRLGDVVQVRPEPNAKYASSVKILPFEDTLDDFKGGQSWAWRGRARQGAAGQGRAGGLR